MVHVKAHRRTTKGAQPTTVRSHGRVKRANKAAKRKHYMGAGVYLKHSKGGDSHPLTEIREHLKNKMKDC